MVKSTLTALWDVKKNSIEGQFGMDIYYLPKE